MVCLDLKNKDVREWVDLVGIKETYKQLITHNYNLPTVSEFEKVQKESLLTLKQVKDLYENLINVSDDQFKSLEELKNRTPEAQAAFWKDIFYFDSKVDKRQAYEEVFHKIFQTLTTDEERQPLFEVGKELLKERLKIQGKSWNTHFKEQKERLNLEDNRLEEYLIEEEIAKEYVNFATYGSTIDSALKDRLTIFSSEKLNNLVNSLINFFRKLFNIQKTYRQNKEKLISYFSDIQSGRFKDVQVIQDNTYITPSYSPLYIQKDDQTSVFNVSLQRTYLNTILDIVRQLIDISPYTEQGNPFTKEELIDKAITVFKDVYKKSESLDTRLLVDSLNDVENGDFFFDDTLPEFERSKNYTTVFNEVSNLLDKTKLSQLEDLEDIEDKEEDTGYNIYTDTSDQADTKDYFKSFSKMMKVYLSTIPVSTEKTSRRTLFTESGDKQQFTIKVRHLVDPLKVYASAVKVTANSNNTLDRMKKLITFTLGDSNAEMKAFVDKFLYDVFLENESENPKALLSELKQHILNLKDETELQTSEKFSIQNTSLFQTLNKSFNLFTRDYRMYFIDNEGSGKVVKINPSHSNVVNIQLSSWQSNWERTSTNRYLNNKSIFMEGFGNSFMKEYIELSDNENQIKFLDKKADQIRKFFNILGADVNSNYIDWILADHVVKNDGFIPGRYRTLYDSYIIPENAIFKLDKLGGLIAQITKQNNAYFENSTDNLIFDPYFEDNESSDNEGMLGRLKTAARGNAYFDENIILSSFLDSDNKMRYGHQHQTILLNFAYNILTNEDKYNTYLESLGEFKENPLTNFYNSLSKEQRLNLGVFSSLGITKQKISPKGSLIPTSNKKSSVNEVNPDLFITNNINALLQDFITKEEKAFANYHVSTLESSNTNSYFTGTWFGKREEVVFNDPKSGSTKKLLDNTLITRDGKVTKEATELVKSLVDQEFNRIQKEKEFLKDAIDQFKGELQSETLENGETIKYYKVNLSEKNIRSISKYQKSNIINGYHTGNIYLDENLNIHPINNERSKTARSLVFSQSLEGLINDEVKYKYNQLSKGEEIDITDSLSNSINWLLDKHLDEIVLTKEDVDNIFYKKAVDIEGINKQKKLGLYTFEDSSVNFKLNSKIFFLNDIINKISFNRLLFGDFAVHNKNELDDYSKRVKALESNVVSTSYRIVDIKKGIDREFTTLKVVQMSEAASFKDDLSSVQLGEDGKSVPIDSDDAQTYSSVEHFRKVMFGLGRLTNKMTHLINKISEGVPLTVEEKKNIETLEFFNILKVRGYGKDLDLKTGSFFISKQFAASKRQISQEEYRQNGIDYYYDKKLVPPSGINSFTIPLPNAKKLVSKEIVDGKEVYYEWYDDGTRTYLFDKMMLLEGWRKEKGEWTYKGNDYKIDTLSPTSAHKRKKQNVWDGKTDSFDNDIHNQLMDIENNNLYGLQVENPSGKSQITDPTQETEIILSEISGNVEIYDKNGKLKEILDRNKIMETYEKLQAQRITNSWDLAINDVLTKEGDPNYKYFWKNVQEGLMDTGGDQQSLDFLNLIESKNEDTGEITYTPQYNGNIPIIKNKIEQMIFSYFSKGVLKQKRAGDSKALFSARGIGLVKKLEVHEINGKKVYTWKTIQKSDSDYRTSLALAQNYNFVQKALTFNGQDERPELNTLQVEFDRMISNGDFYFIDELRHLKPRIVNNKITGYYSEAMMPSYRHNMNSIQDSFRYMSGVRIPSQDKATSANIEWVEMMPYEYGNSIATAKEIQELAGSDFDIDKLFVSYPEGYWERDVFIPYENVGVPSVMFERYKQFLQNKPKSIYKKRLREELLENKVFNELKTEVVQTRIQLSKILDDYSEYLNSLYNEKKVNEEILKDFQSDLTDMRRNVENYKSTEDYIMTTEIVEETEKLLKSIRSSIKDSKFKKSNLENKLAQLNIDLRNLRGLVEEKVLKELNLPYTQELYMDNIYVNTGLVNNELLDLKQSLLTHNYYTYSRPTDVGKLKFLGGETFGVLNRDNFEQGINISPFTSLYQRNYRKKVFAAKTGIASAVNANLIGLVATRLGIVLNEDFHFNIKDKNGKLYKFDRFEENTKVPLGTPDQEVLGWISSLITATTDEAKEGVLAYFNLSDQGLDVFATGLLLGVHPEILIKVINNPTIQSAIRRSKRDPLSTAKVESIESLLESYRLPKELDGSNKNFVLELDNIDPITEVEMFMRIYQVSKQNSDFVKFIRLKRGYGATYDDFNKIIKSGLRLGLDNENLKLEFYQRPLVQEQKEYFEQAYNLPYYLEKNKENVGLIWTYMKDIVPNTSDVLSKFLIEGSENYQTIYSHMNKVSNVSNYKIPDFKKEVFIAILGRMLKSKGNTNLNAELLFDVGNQTLGERYLEIIKENENDEVIKNSILFKKLLPNLGVTKRKQKNNRYLTSSDYTDTFSLKVFSKLTPEMNSDLMDDYFYLSKHPDEKVRSFIDDLFNYYIIKDAMFFSPSGISKIFPVSKFKDLSDSLDKFMSQPVASLEQNLRIIEQHILTDIRNKDFVKEIPAFVSVEGEEINTYYRNGGLVSLIKGTDKVHVEEEMVNKNILTKNKDKVLYPEVIKIGDNLYKKVNNGLMSVDYVLTPTFGTENFYSSITNKTIINPLENIEGIIKELEFGLDSVDSREKLPKFVKKTLKDHINRQIDYLKSFEQNKSLSYQVGELSSQEESENNWTESDNTSENPLDC